MVMDVLLRELCITVARIKSGLDNITDGLSTSFAYGLCGLGCCLGCFDRGGLYAKTFGHGDPAGIGHLCKAAGSE